MAVENFTTYTEVDPNNRITVTASRITFSIQRDEDAYVYKDKGVNHFDGDYEHLLEVYIAGTINNAVAGIGIVANDINTWQEMINTSKSALGVIIQNIVPGNENIYLAEINSGSPYYSAIGGLSENTVYYLTIKRDEAVGAYGTIYLYVYTDAERTNLFGSTSITLHTSKKDYRYIYGLQGNDEGQNIPFTNAYVQNLDLQEVPAAVPLSFGYIF